MKLVENLMVYKGQYGYQTLLKNGDETIKKCLNLMLGE